MRAWIEEDGDNADADLHKRITKAVVCEYLDGEETGTANAVLSLGTKKYYIEYPEQEVVAMENRVKVRVDLAGLTNEDVVTLFQALNSAGFEAVFLPETKPYVYPNNPLWPGLIGTPRAGDTYITNEYTDNPKFG